MRLAGLSPGRGGEAAKERCAKLTEGKSKALPEAYARGEVGACGAAQMRRYRKPIILSVKPDYLSYIERRND